MLVSFQQIFKQQEDFRCLHSTAASAILSSMERDSKLLPSRPKSVMAAAADHLSVLRQTSSKGRKKLQVDATTMPSVMFNDSYSLLLSTFSHVSFCFVFFFRMEGLAQTLAWLVLADQDNVCSHSTMVSSYRPFSLVFTPGPLPSSLSEPLHCFPFGHSENEPHLSVSVSWLQIDFNGKETIWQMPTQCICVCSMDCSLHSEDKQECIGWTWLIGCQCHGGMHWLVSSSKVQAVKTAIGRWARAPAFASLKYGYTCTSQLKVTGHVQPKHRTIVSFLARCR